MKERFWPNEDCAAKCARGEGQEEEAEGPVSLFAFMMEKKKESQRPADQKGRGGKHSSMSLEEEAGTNVSTALRRGLVGRALLKTTRGKREVERFPATGKKEGGGVQSKFAS